MAEFQSKFTGQEVDNAIDKLRTWIGVDGTYPTVTISGVTYAVIWKSIPVSGTPCYGIGLHPTTGRVYEIYYNGSSYTATALDTDTKNTTGATNSTNQLYLVGAGSQGTNPQTFSNSQVYTTDGTLYLTKTTDLSGTANNHPALIVGGTDTAAHLEVDANEIHAKATGTTVAPLYLNHDGGNTYLSGEKTYSDGTYLYSNSTKVSVEGHTHDNRYYTETEIDTKLSGKSDTNHTHDDRYYTETEIDTKLSGKSDIDHTHSDYLPLSGGDLSGSVVPQTNNSYNLGTNSNRWANIYATTFYENGTALSSKYQAKGDYLQLAGGSVTGDLALYAASGNSPRLIFQRGNLKDALTDWSLYDDNSGDLYIQQNGNESTEWETRARFSRSGVNFAGTISEDGASLDSKYLGKTAKAADADKLDGNDSTYYLNYNNLTNKPTLGTAASKNTGTSSGNIPILDSNGKLAESVIPAVAITDTYVVATETAMLALSAQKGDIAIRSDLNKSFVLQATPASTLANWKELLTPTDAVLSVNGKTGAVTLNLDNINDGSTRKLENYVPKSLTSTKGDMIYASDANTPARLAIGSNGQFLSIANGVPAWVNNPNTNTWRKIQLNGTDKLGAGTNTNPLNIKAGNNMTITESNGTFTFAATDTNTDTKVTAVGNHYTPANGTNLTVSSSGTASRGSTKVLTNIAIDAAGHITGGTWYTLPSSDNTDTDTKNTAGSTSSASKLFLVGATSQAANPQTYSYSTVYETSGTLNATKFTVDAEHTGGTIQYNAANGCMEIIC